MKKLKGIFINHKGRGKCFPIEYYPGEILTAAEARRNRRLFIKTILKPFTNTKEIFKYTKLYGSKILIIGLFAGSSTFGLKIESTTNTSYFPLQNKSSIEKIIQISPGGDIPSKSGPGARAKANARRNARAGKFSSGSSLIPGADGFVPKNPYSPYQKYDLGSCKPIVKVAPNPFFNDGSNGNNNQPPPENFDSSKYKGGPSPFKEYEYKDPAAVAQKIGFNKLKRLNKSYDKHAKDCFGITENRNKENL